MLSMGNWQQATHPACLYLKMASVVDVETADVKVEEDKKNRGAGCLTVKLATDLSFYTNILLFIAKIVAAVSSGSIAVLASTVDSFLDLLSGSIVWLTVSSVAISSRLKIKSIR